MIDLKNIQVKHEKSQQEAFEKLCCQLFFLLGREQNWDRNAIFINKNGYAGDSGIEAYWQFNDQSEYGIQVKFADNLDCLCLI